MHSIELSAAAGFDFCELDVWLTSDSVPVVVHNATINATYRSKRGYEPLSDPITVNENTFADLRKNYIGIADDPVYRTEIPTLEECLTLTKSLGIIPMIHPKNHDNVSVSAIMAVCDKIMGLLGYYIVAENDACMFAVARDPEQPVMPVITSKADIDHWKHFPNAIIAIRRAPDYYELVDYAHEHAHLVETTLNDDVRVELVADVINYDYLTPGRFDLCTEVSDRQLPFQRLKQGETLTLTDSRVMYYGTAEVSFTLNGSVQLTICGHTYTLHTDAPTAYRVPMAAYNCMPSVTLHALGDAEICNMRLRVGEHLSK